MDPEDSQLAKVLQDLTDPREKILAFHDGLDEIDHKTKWMPFLLRDMLDIYYAAMDDGYVLQDEDCYIIETSFCKTAVMGRIDMARTMDKFMWKQWEKTLREYLDSNESQPSRDEQEARAREYFESRRNNLKED